MGHKMESNKMAYWIDVLCREHYDEGVKDKTIEAAMAARSAYLKARERAENEPR